MKILFVCHSEDWAGAESSLHALFRRLDPKVHEPLVVLPTNGRMSARMDRLGVPYQFGFMVPWVDQATAAVEDRFAKRLEWRVDAMAARIEQTGCDLVFSNSAVVLEGALAAHRTGRPHVWRVHEMLSRHTNFSTALSLAVYPKLLERLSASVAVVSEAVRADLEGMGAEIPPEVLRVIPNGVEPFVASGATREALLGVDDDVPVVVFVGTLSEAKGVPLLAPIMARVRASVPNARCVLVGRDVGAEAPLRRQLRKDGLEGAFSFLGFRDDAMQILGRADALVLPSRVDSLPCVVMESMATGVPAVATRSGGAAELIADGVSGFLADVGDANGMADALVSILSDRKRGRALGAAALERARTTYGMERAATSLTQIFDALAAKPLSPQLGASRSLVKHIANASGTAPSPQATAKLFDYLDAMTPHSA